MKKYLLLIPILIALAGCGKVSDPEVRAANKENLSTEGFYIGTLPDGRTVKYYYIDRGSGNYPHFIYVVSDNSSTSTNFTQSAGKTSFNQTIVVINGKEYVEKAK